VNLGFTFIYFSKTYTQVTISSNGYVCLGENINCGNLTRTSPFDILIGLNGDLDTINGQINFQNVNEISSKFTAPTYVHLLNFAFVPTNIFLITYDSVLPNSKSFNTGVSFQIFLATDSVNSYVTFKYTSCPSDLNSYSSSGLKYNNGGKSEELFINNNQQCNSSNVRQTGVWVKDVTSCSLGKNKVSIIIYKLISFHF